MSVEQNRLLVHRWAELFNRDGDLRIVDEIVHPDFVSHSSPPGLPPGPEGVKLWASLFRDAFADLYSTIDDVIVEGDKAVERFTGGGTHTGEFFGIPPTGKQAVITGVNIFRVADGMIVEHWGNSDDLGMLYQLGALSAPEPTSA